MRQTPDVDESHLKELTYLYEQLTAEERDELLQCVLLAAPRWGEAMIAVLEELLLCHTTDELPKEHNLSQTANGRPGPLAA